MTAQESPAQAGQAAVVLASSAPKQEPHNEVIFKGPDAGWNGREMPVTLITYEDGSQDLHRQTGSQFDEHVAEAAQLLAARGLAVGKVEFIGPTGAYMRVTPTRAG